ncbi:MAG: hypothetical protein ACTHLZ_04315 [Tepidisphaeraceae bacterium]
MKAIVEIRPGVVVRTWGKAWKVRPTLPKKIATGRNDSVIIPTYLLLLPPVSPLDAPPSSGTGGIFTR